jgi:D-serine deaminase-like pyridoxal phosphate-dependent protein
MTPLPTPALVVDRQALERNIARMQGHAAAAGVALRPHVKGHKCAWIAARQLRAGAAGPAAATLEEAAGLLTAGLGGDVLLTSELPPQAADDVVRLQRLGDLAVVADDPAFVAALAAAATRASGRERPIRVFADLDVGQARGGAASAERALAVAAAVGEHAGTLAFGGVQAYEGHAQLAPDEDRRRAHASALARLEEILAALRAAGHDPPVVTSAGTGTAQLALARGPRTGGPITEIQPGSYALMDTAYRAAGAEYDFAAHVVTAVRSVLSPTQVVVDAGLKAVSIDMHAAHPARPADLDATWSPAGDEHGVLDGAVGDLRPGELVRLVPSHTDTTVRLHRRIWLDGVVPVPLF